MPINNFYADLISINSFSRIGEEIFYKDVPYDWYVVITDVVNSTGAIDRG